MFRLISIFNVIKFGELHYSTYNYIGKNVYDLHQPTLLAMTRS